MHYSWNFSATFSREENKEMHKVQKREINSYEKLNAEKKIFNNGKD